MGGVGLLLKGCGGGGKTMRIKRTVRGDRGQDLTDFLLKPAQGSIASSRDEGLLFLYGLESNPESSLQTPQEA